MLNYSNSKLLIKKIIAKNHYEAQPTMIIYNVTINIEQDIQQDWLDWMTQVHIPEVMATGSFTGFKLLHLLNEEPNNSGITYAVQYSCENLSVLNDYLQHHAQGLQQKLLARYPNKHVAFRTFLKQIAAG